MNDSRHSTRDGIHDRKTHPQERGVAAAAAAAHGHAARRRAAAAAAARAVGRFAAVGLAAFGIATSPPASLSAGPPIYITILFLFIRSGIVPSKATREEPFLVSVGRDMRRGQICGD